MSLLGSTFGLSSLTRSRRVDSPRLRDAHAAAARQVEDARLARVGAEAVARGRVRLPTGCLSAKGGIRDGPIFGLVRKPSTRQRIQAQRSSERQLEGARALTGRDLQ